MGCTSGAVRVKTAGENKKMLHFRTLDWGMDALRKVVVNLDFIEKPGGEVIVRTSVAHVSACTEFLRYVSGRSTLETSSKAASCHFKEATLTAKS